MLFQRLFQVELMRRSCPTARVVILVAIAALGIASTMSQAQVRERPRPEDKIPGPVLSALASGEEQDVIIVFDDGAIEQQAATMRRSARMLTNDQGVLDFKSTRFSDLKQAVLGSLATGGTSVLREYSHLPMSFVKVHSNDALMELASRPEILAVYEDEIMYRALAQSLPLINQPQVAAAGYTGAGTTVAVMDTGVDYTRAAFGSCSAPGEPGCSVVYAQDFAANDGMLDDPILHGTNVAGTVLGVAPDAGIAALDVFVGQSAYSSDIIAAINWSIDNQATYNIVSMNFSLSSSVTYSSICPASPYTTAFANARQAGIVPVVASGNGARTNGMGTPACTPGAVRVGAVYDADLGEMVWTGLCTDSTTAADQVTCFSNAADFLTILAPGSVIQAAGVSMSGTSQATPHVAGAVAVLMGVNPALTPESVESSMTSSGVPIQDLRIPGSSFPRLDLQGAVAVVGDNSPPYAPSNPLPPDNATIESLDPVLSWTGGDPDTGDTVTYDVYFGTTTDPPLVSENQSTTVFNPGHLATGVYYWRVVARDEQGFVTQSPTWTFSIVDNYPPFAPSNPLPPDNATGISSDPILSWTAGDPDPGDVLTYDVYFGSSTDPPLVSQNQSATVFDPGHLSVDVYHWRVVARDDQGLETQGPTWTFTSGSIVCFNAVQDGSFEGGTPSSSWNEIPGSVHSPICS